MKGRSKVEDRTKRKLNILMYLLFCEMPTAIFPGILRVLFRKSVTYIRKKLQYFITKEVFNEEHQGTYSIIGMVEFSVSV